MTTNGQEPWDAPVLASDLDDLARQIVALSQSDNDWTVEEWRQVRRWANAIVVAADDQLDRLWREARS